MKTISTLDYKNPGRMSDRDGPAFVAYSKTGYTGVSAALDLANTKVCCALSDGKFVNAYAFLGIDVFGETEWENCVDVGFCWAGAKGGWHIFYNIFQTLDPETPWWWESDIVLPGDDIYDLKLELIGEEKARFTVSGRRTCAFDSVSFELKGAKTDGSNTSCLFNAALDFPPDTKIDRKGNPCEDDWQEIVLANTDKGAYLKNMIVSELKLYNGTSSVAWTDDCSVSIGIWPDKEYTGFDYAPTKVICTDGTEYHIDLDMNR